MRTLLLFLAFLCALNLTACATGPMTEQEQAYWQQYSLQQQRAAQESQAQFNQSVSNFYNRPAQQSQTRNCQTYYYGNTAQTYCY